MDGIVFDSGFNASGAHITPDVSEFLPLDSIPTMGEPALDFGALTLVVAQPVVLTRTGAIYPAFDEVIAGKMFVIPRLVAAGFVVSEQRYSVQIWNNTGLHQSLTNIQITGAGADSVTIDSPYGTSETMPATAFLTGIELVIAAQGPAQVNELVTFVFASGLTGTDIAVSGSRLVVFSVPINWDGALKEQREYLTDILTGYDGSEQRIQLRAVPRHRIAYRVDCDGPRASANMEALIYGWQQRPYAVPWWQDAQPLLQDVSVGSTVIYVDTSNREFVTGGVVLLYRGQFEYEAFTITTVNAGNIVVANQAGKAWKAGSAVVIPAKIARLGSIETERPNAILAGADVSFDVEVV